MKRMSKEQMGRTCLLLVLFALFTSGCAIGVTRVKLDHDPLARVENKREGTILVEPFKDVRPQAKEYIGNKRNMYGMVLGHIGTEVGVNLTEILTRYFAEAIREAGYTVVIGKGTKAAEGQGNFDAMVEGEILTFWMDLYMAVWHKVGVKVMVKNPEGKILWEATVSGEETNALWIGATGEYEKVIRQAVTKALNRAASEFASEPFYQAVKAEKPRARIDQPLLEKERSIPFDRGTSDVDWPYPRKEQLPAPPIEKTKAAITIKFADVTLPEYEISPPPTNAPPEIRGLLGRWHGYWNNGVAIAMVFQKVYLEERRVECIYAWGHWGPNKDRKPGFRRLFANLTPGPKPQIKFRIGDGDYTFALKGKFLYGTEKFRDGAIEVALEKVE